MKNCEQKKIATIETADGTMAVMYNGCKECLTLVSVEDPTVWNGTGVTVCTLKDAIWAVKHIYRSEHWNLQMVK